MAPPFRPGRDLEDLVDRRVERHEVRRDEVLPREAEALHGEPQHAASEAVAVERHALRVRGEDEQQVEGHRVGRAEAQMAVAQQPVVGPAEPVRDTAEPAGRQQALFDMSSWLHDFSFWLEVDVLPDPDGPASI